MSAGVEAKTKIGLIGCGTVGTGVAKILLDYGDRTARHAGHILWVEKAVVRNLNKDRGIDLPAGVLTENPREILDDPEIKVVALLIGGLEPARTLMLQLLEHGKDVVTANKALLAEHGPELFDKARALGRCIAFEAAVAGGIPIITPLSQCFTANQVESIHAVLNGTSNFILDQMETEGQTYEAAVAEAQRLGYAEADPAMDVDGTDAAQKLAILAHLAFGVRVRWQEIPRRGIDALAPLDIKFARELGHRIKLLAVAESVPEGLELHVSPTLVKLGTPLSEVHGASNALSVVGDAVGRVFFHGMGAGQMPTASAVVADLIDTVVGRTAITFRTLKLWSKEMPKVTPRNYDNVPSRFYLRFLVEDRPGVMANLAGALGAHEVSIASIIQHEAPEQGDKIVPLVIMTHRTPAGAARRALQDIDRMPCVRGCSVQYRVHE